MSNSVSAALLTDKLEVAAMTVLGDQFAPLSAFAREFSPDELKPLATVQVKLVTASDVAQTNPTNFESNGDSTISNVAIVPVHVCQSFQISNSDLQSGLRLADLTEINAKAFAAKLLDLAFAVVTEENFGAAVVTSAAAAFDWPDIPALWASLKKSDKKTLVLDSEFFARLLNKPSFFQTIGPGPGGFKTFGLDGVYSCSRFTAAGPGVSGFICHPNAVAVVSGTPLVPAGGGAGLGRQQYTLPGLNLTVVTHQWISLATRTLWASYDAIFGAAVGDPSCLKILKST